MKKLFVTLLIVGLAGMGAEIAFDLYYFVAPNNSSNQKVVLMVEPGSFQKTVDQLTNAGIIGRPRRFYFLGRLLGISKRVRVGEYEFSPNMSPKQVMAVLTSGKSILHPVKIPEGYNLEQISEVLAEQNLVDKEEFLKTVSDKRMAQMMDIDAPSLEGFLYPDTYSFTRFTGERQIIKTMVDRFKAVYKADIDFAAKKMGWTMLQVVTLASIIEKETGAPEERPLISSVFHNRLKIKMPLQSDPTVIYGKKGDKKNITREDLKNPTPYNTYTIKALPVGPIASPGRDSLIATVDPAQTTYLYFVSKNQGTHYFSSNIYDHNTAVNKYQRDRKNREGHSWRERTKK